MGGLWSC
ncbi:Hypothetical protein SCV20265 5644 [Pseudomonas aeruginosa]|nr:Hypothetical protein SCV20265 5644 [Pseudomonas aeruginosa]